MLQRIKSRQKSSMLEAQGLRAVEVKPKTGSGTRNSMKLSQLRQSRQDNGDSTKVGQSEPVFFNIRKRNKTPDNWCQNNLKKLKQGIR